MAIEGKVAYVAEHLNYSGAHLENVRTRTRSEALDVSEYFYVMLSILERVAPKETLTDRGLISEILVRLPSQLCPAERIQISKQALSSIAAWNLRHNQYVSRQGLLANFMDWDFALVGREFEISASVPLLLALFCDDELEGKIRQPVASVRCSCCRLPSQTLARENTRKADSIVRYILTREQNGAALNGWDCLAKKGPRAKRRESNGVDREKA